MSKARTLANLISDNAELADGQISVAEVVGAAPTASPTFTGNIDAGDNVKIRLGDSDDLQIYHDGSHSYVSDEGTGNLNIQSNGTQINLQKSDGTKMIEAINNGNVVLYSNGTERLRANGTGIDVTGNATFADNGKAIFGADSDLQIYHTGSASIIRDQGVGSLYIDGGSEIFLRGQSGYSNMVKAIDGAEVQLYHNNNLKLATTATGVDVTGTVTSDGLTVENNSGATINVNTALTGADSKILLHEGSTASPTNGASIRYAGATNEFSIGVGSSVDTKRLSIARDTGDISFYEDTGTTAKLTWDASAERLGLGTSSPSWPLEISASGGNSRLELNRSDINTTGMVGAISFTASDSHSVAAIDVLGDGDNEGAHLRFLTTSAASSNNHFSSATERMRITSTGKVGIGTVPTANLHVIASGTDNLTGVLIESTDASASTSPDLALYKNSASPADDDSLGALWFYGKNSADERILYGGIFARSADVTDGTEDGDLLFFTRGAGSHTEVMRLDNEGDLLVGKTAASTGTAGCELRANGKLVGTIDGGNHTLGRLTSVGDILKFAKDDVTVGRLGMDASFYIDGTTNEAGLQFRASDIVPRDNGALDDNAIDLGDASYRFDDIFATNGTIQTSDANEKQDIAALTSAEMLVAKRISALFKTFRWKDKVAAKGNDARTHTGIIAQDVQAAFTAEGLDAGDYSLFISSTWWETQTEVPEVEAVAEVTDEDGNVTTEAVEAVDAYTRTDTYDTEAEAPEGATERTRLGIRYPELLAFVGAYNEQRFASIEARLTALEG